MAKTGRNEPCPCGSGKKYKHCHLREHARAALEANAASEDDHEPDPMGGAPELSEEERQAQFEGISINAMAVMLVAGALVSGTVGLFTQAKFGWILFGLGLLGMILWASVRKPPPPRDDSENPASINFGK